MDDGRIAYPHNLEAERALLGGLMMDPDRLARAAEIIDGDDFYRQDHAALFKLLQRMNSDGRVIDMVTVPDLVERDNNSDTYGGVEYVVQLPDHAPSTANLEHYARVVKEMSILRQVIKVGQGAAKKSFSQPEDIETLIEELTRDVLTLKAGADTRGWEQISLTIDAEVARIAELSESSDEVSGVSTGFVGLDKMLAGFQPSDLIVLAARPGMGKTALALNLVMNAALGGDVAVGVFSLEMGRGQLVTRLLSAEGMVQSEKLRTGRLDPDDWTRLTEAAETLRGARIHIDDTPGMSISGVRARARRLYAKDPTLKLIVIDYLQLMRGDDPRSPREQQVASISRGLKGLAKELGVTVIALSQLNRGVEQRAEKEPMISDLRESGAIEQDADIIMFIYRDDYYNEDSPDKGLAKVIVAKQRNGPTGDTKLVFQGEFTRFFDLAADAHL